VDRYITGLLVPPDEALDGALRDSVAAGLPPIAVSPTQGKLLHRLARMQGARIILEIGTLGGYSTIWLARALPASGRLVTLEVDPRHAETARANLARAGLAEVVELRLGPALETLPDLIAEKRGPFDLIFIDADKGAIPEYFVRALEISRRGTMIIVDNVVRNGAVADPASTDPAVLAVPKIPQQALFVALQFHPGSPLIAVWPRQNRITFEPGEIEGPVGVGGQRDPNPRFLALVQASPVHFEGDIIVSVMASSQSPCINQIGSFGINSTITPATVFCLGELAV